MFLLFPLPQILVPLKCRNSRFFLPKVRPEATRNGLIVIWLTSHLCANSTPPTHTHPPRSQQEKQVRKTRQTYVNAKTLSRRKRNCKWPWVQKELLRSASSILRLLKIGCTNMKTKPKSLNQIFWQSRQARSYDRVQLWSLELVQTPKLCQWLRSGSARGIWGPPPSGVCCSEARN